MSLLRIARQAAVVAVVLIIGGCVSSVIKGIGATREMMQPASAGPAVDQATHGPFSRLPTGITFTPTRRPDVTVLPDWARAEMGVELVRDDSLPGPDGTTYVRFQQYYRGLPVRGDAWTARLDSGQVIELTGLVHDRIDVDPTPRLTPDGARRVITEGAPDLRGVGEPSLEILPIRDTTETRFFLVYRLELLDTGAGDVLTAYVDGRNGAIRGIEHESRSLWATGTGTTTDGRTVTFGTFPTSDLPPPDSGKIEIVDIRDGYMLYDPDRRLHTKSLGGMSEIPFLFFDEDGETREYLGTGYLIPGHELIEEDNVWESTPNAVDVHWGMTVTYDYFLAQHGLRGWDGSNGELRAYVDYNDLDRAYYNPRLGFLAFGNGDTLGRPLTLLDIVAHEYTHAVTKKIVDFRSTGEAGSIEEAVGDIFGTRVEFTQGQGDWIIASALNAGSLSRNLANPKASGNPDTYEGENWGEYQSSYGLETLHLPELTKHQNSTIMSHWFYLLSEGGKGKNDNEEEYDVKPIGMAEAADIVFRALYRMSSSVTFASAREATLAVARQRFGRCSEQVRQVGNAWNAVGVGPPLCECFEGSFDYNVSNDDGQSSLKFYVRGDDFAVEAPTKDGGTAIMYTTAGDPYRHVQGQEDLPATDPTSAFLKTLVQGRVPLIVPVHQPMSRKEYIRYRNQHRTGQSRAMGTYTTYQYLMEDMTVWATEDVCLDLTDWFGVIAMPPPGLSGSTRQVFFGFPVEFRRGTDRVWIENLRQHPIDDRYFRN